LTDDRRILPIERTGEELQAPDEFMLVVSYNPGYQNILKNLKPSTRQRFIAIQFDYPSADLEQKIIVQETGVSEKVAHSLVSLANQFRRLKNQDLEEAASTRLLVYAASLMHAGCDAVQACQAAMVEPLTDDADTIAALKEVIKANFNGKSA
jgi:nitric oxide reductase NorQ protein